MAHQSRNFSFLKEADPVLYEQLCRAESQAYVDTEDACFDIGRHALERFITRCIEDHFSESVQKELKSMHLHNQILALTKADELKRYGYLKKNESLTKKNAIIKENREVQYTAYNSSGQTFQRTDYLLDFLRQMGNSESHIGFEGGTNFKVRLTFDNLLIAFKGFHAVLKCYFNPDNPGRIASFDAQYIPVGEFDVLRSSTPSDRALSKCERECFAARRNDRGHITDFALLRIYNKKELGGGDGGNVVLRNQRSFEHAASQLDEDEIRGIPRFFTLVPSDSSKSEYYIIGYMFKTEPYRLADKLREMNRKERLKVCAVLLRAMDAIHSFESPMYHRVLNHECILVRKTKDSFIPYIVKFDYAKINFSEMNKTLMRMDDGRDHSASGIETVYAQAKRAGGHHTHNRYRSLIWDSVSESAGNEEWRAIDVYSLGVLITDILYGQIAPRKDGAIMSPAAALKELCMLKESDDRRIAVSKPLFDLIAPMLQNDLSELMEVSLEGVALMLESEAEKE